MTCDVSRVTCHVSRADVAPHACMRHLSCEVVVGGDLSGAYRLKRLRNVFGIFENDESITCGEWCVTCHVSRSMSLQPTFACPCDPVHANGSPQSCPDLFAQRLQLPILFQKQNTTTGRFVKGLASSSVHSMGRLYTYLLHQVKAR